MLEISGDVSFISTMTAAFHEMQNRHSWKSHMVVVYSSVNVGMSHPALSSGEGLHWGSDYQKAVGNEMTLFHEPLLFFYS